MAYSHSTRRARTRARSGGNEIRTHPSTPPGPQVIPGAKARSPVPPIPTTPNLRDIADMVSDGIAVAETAARAMESDEAHDASAMFTLRLGLRKLLDAYALIDAAAGGAS